MRRSLPRAFRDEKAYNNTTKKALAQWRPSVNIRKSPIDVVGPKLCDDVISYLRPTLEQHKGCTLVDFFPGSATFSQKLHEYLRPKSHILIEPEDFFYEPFIEPLVKAPDSKYRHVKLGGRGIKTHWYEFRTTFETQLPELSKRSQDSIDSEFDGMNSNVLVIGNASRLCPLDSKLKLWKRGYPFGLGVLRALGRDALTHDLFNRHGPVRMLWWFPEKFKPLIIPPHYMYGRSSFNSRLEMAYDVSEVAGVRSNTLVRSVGRTDYNERERSDDFKLLDHEAVAKRMKDTGLILPTDRKSLDVYDSSPTNSAEVQPRSPLLDTAKTVHTLREQMKNLKERMAGLSTWIVNPRASLKGAGVRQKIQDALLSIDYPQCIYGKEAYPHNKALFVRNHRFVILADVGLRVANIEAGYMDVQDKIRSEDVREKLRNSVMSLDKEFRALYDGQKALGRLLDDFIEEQLTFYSPSPVSSLERRAYEPLQAETSDFFPKHDMALLDFVPRGTKLYVPGIADRQECTTLLNNLLQHLFTARSIPLPTALDKAIGNNAGRDLVRMVPAITDIRKGGRLDPKNMRVRALTTEMIDGLVKAFFEWPFRPENWQLSRQKDAEKEAEAGDT